MSAPLKLEGPNEASMQLAGSAIRGGQTSNGHRTPRAQGLGPRETRLRAAPLRRSLAVWGVSSRGTVGPKLSVGQMARILFFKPWPRKT
jgi:hypothetical protein